VLLVALAVMLAGVMPVRQTLGQHRAVAEAQERLASLEAENAVLMDQVAALATDAEIERRARAEFGFVAPGEIPYVVSGEAPPDDLTSTAAVPASDRTRTWWERFVDFLTGGDLVRD
jgi:hypothetical protein